MTNSKHIELEQKVKIELTPYNALAILSFMREYINDENKHDPELKAIHESVDEFTKQIYTKMTMSQLNAGIFESKVNDMIGKHPVKK